MKDTLECFYQQKIIGLHDRLIKENFSWNVGINLMIFFLYLSLIFILFYEVDCSLGNNVPNRISEIQYLEDENSFLDQTGVYQPRTQSKLFIEHTLSSNL